MAAGAQFKELGLPLGLIEHLQIAPAPLDLDEESDPYGVAADAANARTSTAFFWDRHSPLNGT
jgi:hypothetical protein